MYTTTISEIMTTELVTISPDDNLQTVKEIFETHNFHHLPVVDQDNKVLGIISQSDLNLLCNKWTFFREKQEEFHNRSFLRGLLASEVMITKLATLKPNSLLPVAVGFFKENLFHAIPVVDDENKLLGILTTYDLINHAYNTAKV